MATLTTSNGRTYEFDIKRLSDGSYRPYIVRQPGYGSRDTSCEATHRLWVQEGNVNRPFVCWTSKLRTEREAMEVAKGWAVRTDVYINTGVWKR